MKINAPNLFTQEDFDAFDDLLQQLENLVKDKLAALTPKERSDLGTINEKNKLFVNKTLDLHRADKSKSSPDVDWTEFEAHYNTRRFMETRSERLGSIVYRMQSTKILHDFSNFQDGRNNYSHAKYRAKVGDPGYVEIVAELKQFFAHDKKNTKKTEKKAETNEPDA